MKRGLAFALAALALVAGNAAVQAADIDLSLNLRYTDPADPSEGGRWFLMAKTNTANASTGIAGLSVYLTNIDSTGIVWGNGTAVGSGVAQYPVVTGATLGANVQTPGNTPFNSTSGGITNVVYGQDLVTTIKTIGEGSGTGGNLTNDPLRNPAWANSTLVMSGTFTGGGNAGNKFNRPAFATTGTLTDGNVFNGAGAAVDATISTTVRGDSVRTLGLESPLGTPNAGLIPGDANRDGVVNVAGDGFAFSANIGLPNRTWDQGDFNDSGTVTVNPDGFTLSANFGQSFVPPAVGAVPEPATLSLVGLGLFGLAGVARRRNA